MINDMYPLVKTKSREVFGKHYIYGTFLLLLCVTIPRAAFSQQVDDSIPSLSLQQCIDYALQHQPALQQAVIGTSIAKTTNQINQSGWYPQVGVTANLNHYLQRPTTLSNINGVQTPVQTSLVNTSTPGIGVTQAIFQPSLIYASRIAPLSLKKAEQTLDSTKIDLVVNVSKSYYSLLLTLEQIGVLKEDTARLGESMRTSYHQYVGGIVDETDYEQAKITLNTSMVQLIQANESVFPLYATLKQLMGFPSKQQFNVAYDSAQIQQELTIDLSEELQYDKRIELKQLRVMQDMQKEQTRYFSKTYIFPTLSGFFNYNASFQNNSFAKLYNVAYPNSIVGLTLSMPVFAGFYRTKNAKLSRLNEQVLNWSEVNLKSNIYTEYATALANYKGNYYNMQQMKDNVDLAKRVYFVVDLQYKQGLVPYLNVITAETNLRTSELTYLTALFQTISSKIDWQRALGDVKY
ncbi:TolC family protein [Chitinophaga sp. Cy-1792]|uniref:TolC family protein n=1 Tax=Chitinophaga sp. Cy-1792 TaxID=2608339 RepID=UPI0014210029|nr:TolC family protein [Chitinophaga sp. Cy-1792]NIG55935.1 TolC family protein [Chitinophaga sp. Cy-1792]